MQLKTNTMKKSLLGVLIILQFCFPTWAKTFVVKQIEFHGLQRTSIETAESYIHIKRGQTLNTNRTADIVRDLYKTGFFENISLSERNNVLVINVVERPTIGQLKISGNSVIPTDKLTEVMRGLDIAEGRIYNPAVLDKITQGLLNQYYQLGRYNAKVNVYVSPLPRHRVSIKIDISEGLVAKIRRITIMGNHVFSERTLLKQLNMTTSGLLTIFTQTDRYSEAKLDENVEKIRNYYLDHGYLHVEVKSAQAEVTPDRKSVYITIIVNEGVPYTISGYDIDGNLIFTRGEYTKRITIKPGGMFSRGEIIKSQRAISKLLGERGYMYSNISIRPKVDENTHQIFVVFDVDPGKRTYVRRVNFSENARTNEVVLRREVVQMEAAPSSTIKLEESKHRLELLPYIKNVEMSVDPVNEASDQVDVTYKVKEDSSAQASLKIGYSSQADGVILGGGINQKNFLGTGNTFGININASRYEQVFGIEYMDPYFTNDGISQSINFSASRTDPSAIAKLNTGYTANEINFGVLYGIPVGQEIGAYSRIFAGVNYQNIILNVQKSKASNQVLDFIAEHGRHFHELDFKLGYSRDGRDRAIFPTRGTLQSIFLDAYAPLSQNSIAFFTLNYSGKWYQPLTDQFILTFRADLGYGNAWHGVKNYPFFKNFYAGGINSVRGYYALSLGPRDSNGYAYGGTMLADSSLGLIFPNFVSDNLRTSIFVDAGNVYTPLNNRAFGLKSTNSGPIRYSTGIEVDWFSMFGPIQISLSKAINPKRAHQSDLFSVGDDTEAFQLALGANF